MSQLDMNAILEERRAEREKLLARCREVEELRPHVEGAPATRRGFGGEEPYLITVPVGVIQTLLAIYDATAMLTPGDICTWGSGQVAAKVITCDRIGLTVEYENGRRDSWEGLRRPAGTIKLPPGTPLGPLPEPKILEGAS